MDLEWTLRFGQSRINLLKNIKYKQMRTIINVFGWASMGKSSSIRLLAEMLGADINGQNFDIKCTVDYKDRRIGIVSLGDPGYGQEKDIEKAIADGCEIIVCASRTKGETAHSVWGLAKQYGCNLIWTSVCWDDRQIAETNNVNNDVAAVRHSILNKVSAFDLLKLIDAIIENEQAF